MENFDWLEDDSMRSEFNEQVKSAAGRAGLEHYQRGIVDWLLEQMQENSRKNILMEGTKVLAEQRTKGDALSSIEVLVAEASTYASQRESNTLEIDDMRRAYKAKYCRVFPFC